jgi:2-oxoglutarate ferredoxin oxidoreductase subunit beta
MNAYGFHGMHGRALPVACGVRSRRPDLHLFVATGDGDCCSIGAGHWVHAIRYNMKMVVMLLDNNVYGLTKNQTSPTSAKGRKTNTHPRGSLLDPIHPIQTTLGIANRSFVAQTVDWSPAHLQATLRAAHLHPGLAFVRILQRCPHFVTPDFEALQNDPTRLTLLSHPDGIELDDAVKATFKNHFEHDPANLDEARSLAERDDTVPVGLFYRNESAARYDEYSSENLATSRRDKLAALREELSHYEV